MASTFPGIAVVALTCCLLFPGCSANEYRFRKSPPAPVSAGRIPLTLALVLPPSVCSRTHVVGDIRQSVFYVGEAICQDLRETAQRTYREVKVVGNPGEAPPPDADAVLDIRVRGIDGYVLKEKIPAVVGYRIGIDWSFATRDGKSRYVRHLKAVGEDDRVFGYVDPRHLASLQRCLDDLAAKTGQEMAVSVENGRKNLVAEEDILAKLGGYEIGGTSLDTYERDKTGHWNVTIRERRSRAEKIAAPGKPEAVFMEIHMKDEIRSAYGEELVCEVEFQGKGTDKAGIRLASLLCRRGDKRILSK